MTIRPAVVPHAGIEFKRVDLPGSSLIRASVARVAPEMRRTVLRADASNPKAASVQTVEHLLSALVGMGVTDAIIELDGPEVPLGDGSALPFVEAIRDAGVAELPAHGDGQMEHAAPSPVVIRERLVIEDAKASADGAGPVSIEALPHDAPECVLEYHVAYPAPADRLIPNQSASMRIPLGGVDAGYPTQVAPARTFCLQHEAQAMRQMGLFTHLSPSEMLVIAQNGPIDNALRFSNEPARHKLLDLLGDLSLCGRAIQGRIIARRTGHAHNHQMARALSLL